MNYIPHNNNCSWLDHGHTSSSASTRAGSRKSRVYLFQEFVWKIYGTYLQEQQQQQQRNTVGESNNNSNHNNKNNRIDKILVLDVAGGKGDLSWLLTHVHGIPSIVVDPQTFPSTNVLDNHKHNNDNNDDHKNNDSTNNSTTVSSSSLDHSYHRHPIEKSVYYLLQHPEEAQRRSIPGLPTYQPLAALLPEIQIQQQQQFKGPPSTQDQPNHNNGPSSSLVGMLPPPKLQPIFTLPIYMNDDLVHAICRQVQGSTATSITTTTSYNNNHMPQPKEDGVNQILTTTTTTREDWNSYWHNAWYHHYHAKPTAPTRSERKRSHSSTSSSSPLRHDSSFTEVNTPDNSSNTNNDNEEPTPPLDALAALRLFSSSIKLIVGFHPDQATEACMDLAVLLQIPFCVVPCCVFPNEFPNRHVPVAVLNTNTSTTTTTTSCTTTAEVGTTRIASRLGSIHRVGEEEEDKSRNGMDRDEPIEEQTSTRSVKTRVRTYSQFITYLKQKYQPHQVQMAELNFDFTETAKNIALYTLPPSS
jgi:hypothetical protein